MRLAINPATKHRGHRTAGKARIKMWLTGGRLTTCQEQQRRKEALPCAGLRVALSRLAAGVHTTAVAPLFRGWVTLVWIGAILLPMAAATAGPEIQHWKTANGARVYFVPAPQLPMVDIRVVFDAGSARDGEQPGLAIMTNALLDAGAGELNEEQIAERLESLGAQLGSAALRDMALVSLRTLSDHQYLEPALEILGTLLSQPRFPEEIFQRERKRMLIGLQAEKQSPASIASKAFYRAIYGDHPYASPSNGTVESIQALRREALGKFHKQYYVAANAVIALVGDLSREQAEKLAGRLVARLPAGQAAPELAEVEPLAKAVRETISFPSSQTHILVGQPGMSRTDPDYMALYVGNHILGGSGFGSRIMAEIREKRGLAYSAYSFFMPMRRKGPFQIGLQTRNDKAAEADRVLQETLRKFIEQGPTAAELEAAKKNITGGFPLRIDSNKDILEYIAMIGFYDLPLDYLDTFSQRVEAVSREAIRDAFQRRTDPEKMATIRVGGSG